MWKDTKSFGIGLALSNEGSLYIVANYSPAGNVHKGFADNVLPPVVMFKDQLVAEKDDNDIIESSDDENG